MSALAQGNISRDRTTVAQAVVAQAHAGQNVSGTLVVIARQTGWQQRTCGASLFPMTLWYIARQFELRRKDPATPGTICRADRSAGCHKILSPICAFRPRSHRAWWLPGVCAEKSGAVACHVYVFHISTVLRSILLSIAPRLGRMLGKRRLSARILVFGFRVRT